MLIFTLNACSSAPNGGGAGNPDSGGKNTGNASDTPLYRFSGKVAHKKDDTILVTGKDKTDKGLYFVSLTNTEIKNEEGDPVKPEAVEEGMFVDILYEGGIMESFPARFGSISELRVSGKPDNLLSFYISVIEDLYGTDPGLNGGISMLAFDLREVSNLSESEKTALLYLVQSRFSLETMSATFDELVENGLVDKDKRYFEKGLFIRFYDMEFEENRFAFDVSKWRSALGAYYFVECVAVKSNGGWTYTVGREAIS